MRPAAIEARGELPAATARALRDVLLWLGKLS